MGRAVQSVHDVQRSGYDPGIAGVKITPIVQEAPPASGVVHGVVPLAAPAKSGLVLVGGRVKPMGFAVLFVIVTYCGSEGVATS